MFGDHRFGLLGALSNYFLYFFVDYGLDLFAVGFGVLNVGESDVP
jgi:hypothetical protein